MRERGREGGREGGRVGRRDGGWEGEGGERDTPHIEPTAHWTPIIVHHTTECNSCQYVTNFS